MNIKNIDKAIAVMKRVQKREEETNRRFLKMSTWQTPTGRGFAKTEDEAVHACGTTCCFAGWLSVSPEFQEMGVYPHPLTGHPTMPDEAPGAAYIFAKLLDVSVHEMECLIHDMPNSTSPADVIAVLEEWKK